jgi:general stress protein YciG
MKTTSRPKGFAAMSKAKQRAIASLGGKAVSAGIKGAKHMAKLGRKGGRNSHKSDWTFLK